MKNLFVTVFCIFVSIGCIGQAKEFISIKHVGISDKPLATITISYHQLSKDDKFDELPMFENLILISKSNFLQLKAYIKSYQPDSSPEVNSKKFYEYGTFGIYIGNFHHKRAVIVSEYFMTTVKQSRTFFKDLLNYCIKNQFESVLVEQIKTNKRRIEF